MPTISARTSSSRWRVILEKEQNYSLKQMGPLGAPYPHDWFLNKIRVNVLQHMLNRFCFHTVFIVIWRFFEVELFSRILDHTVRTVTSTSHANSETVSVGKV